MIADQFDTLAGKSIFKVRGKIVEILIANCVKATSLEYCVNAQYSADVCTSSLRRGRRRAAGRMNRAKLRPFF